MTGSRGEIQTHHSKAGGRAECPTALPGWRKQQLVIHDGPALGVFNYIRSIIQTRSPSVSAHRSEQITPSSHIIMTAVCSTDSNQISAAVFTGQFGSLLI